MVTRRYDETPELDAEEVVLAITNLLYDCEEQVINANDENIDHEIESIASYRDAGVLTNDAGFVLRMVNGDEFQVTVVKSR